MPTKTLIAFRCDTALVEWLDSYALSNRAVTWGGPRRGGDHGGKDTGRSAVLVALLEALREGRVDVRPRAGMNPFPAEEVAPGNSPDFPIAICFHPRGGE